jgi:hypothetical protein
VAVQGANDPGQAGGARYQAQAGGTPPLLRQLHHRFPFIFFSLRKKHKSGGGSTSTLNNNVTIKLTPTEDLFLKKE